MIKRVITAVCVALFLAVQTAFPVYALEEPTAVLNEIFSSVTDGESFFEGMEYGSADRIVYCYSELYGTDGAESYIASARQTAQGLLTSERFVKPTDLQKCAIALSQYGECTQELINAAVYCNEDFDKQGLNAYIWGLIAAARTDLAPPENAVNTQASMAEYLLSRQLEDGGFALTGSRADCDITAAAIYALAPMCGDDKISAAADRAFSAIAAMQSADGSFSGMGIYNCESTAQAIAAAASLGRTEWITESGALAALMSYRTEGGFSHLEGGAANGFATSQACCALTAYLKLTQQTEQTAPEAGATLSEIAKDEPMGTAEAAVQSAEPPLAGDTIKLIAAAVCVVTGAVLLSVWLFGGRKKTILLVAAAAGFVLGVVSAFTDFSTAEEYYSRSQTEHGITVFVSADCTSVFSHADRAAQGIQLPQDGEVIARCAVVLPESSTAFDALVEAARLQKITLDYINSLSGAYIRGIAGLYELDFGSESGWLYYVNGDAPDRAISEYILSDGDDIFMEYTCALGR